MSALLYPASLPCPMPGSFTPRQRRAASSIDGPLQQRARQRDAAGMTSQYTYVYTPAQMAVWLAWYRETLLSGRRWFAADLPGRDGMVQRIVRYTSVRQQLLGAGIYRVEATFEQRGASMDVSASQGPIAWSTSLSDVYWIISGSANETAHITQSNGPPFHPSYPARNLFGDKSVSLIGPSYFEIHISDHSSSAVQPFWAGFKNDSNDVCVMSYSGTVLKQSGLVTVGSFGSQWFTPGHYLDAHVLMIAIDGSGVYFGRSGNWYDSDPASGVLPAVSDWSGAVRPYVASFAGTPNTQMTLVTENFTYPPPAGFQAL